MWGVKQGRLRIDIRIGMKEDEEEGGKWEERRKRRRQIEVRTGGGRWKRELEEIEMRTGVEEEKEEGGSKRWSRRIG